jgi:hypothetical protein
MAEAEALSPGPDIFLRIQRPTEGEGEEETQELTVSWDQSFLDVLMHVEEMFAKRYTLQFVHRTNVGGSKPDKMGTETTVKVEDDAMFDVMVEFALEQPDRRLDVQLVQTHWWPKDGVDNFLEGSDMKQVACAPLVGCCDRQGRRVCAVRVTVRSDPSTGLWTDSCACIVAVSGQGR